MRQKSGYAMGLAGWAFLLLAPAVQAEPVPLTVGDTTIQFPADAGFVRASSADPKFFSFVQAALPTTNRLIEIFITPADLDRLHTTGVAAGPYYEVQVMRELETRPIGMDEWNENKAQLTAGMGKLDMNQLASKEAGGASQRVSAAAGQQVNVNFGKINTPTIYRETPMSVEYGMTVPVQINSGGQTVSATISAAGSFTVAHDRMIFLYAYSSATDEASIADLHKRMDALVDQVQALNPNDPNLSSSPSLLRGVGRAAVIGALVGGIIGVFGLLITKMRKSSSKS